MFFVAILMFIVSILFGSMPCNNIVINKETGDLRLIDFGDACVVSEVSREFAIQSFDYQYRGKWVDPKNPSISEITAGYLGRRASNTSVTRGRPPVIS